jgi:hypothetical protein
MVALTKESAVPYIVIIGTHQRITVNFAQKFSNLSLLVLRTATSSSTGHLTVEKKGKILQNIKTLQVFSKT